jgi:hypothetical protein
VPAPVACEAPGKAEATRAGFRLDLPMSVDLG